MIRVFIGYDDSEPAAYHTCVDSLIQHSSEPLQITPLALNNMAPFYRETHTDGSNAFIYSRFLVPYMCGFNGFALYLDGDMVVTTDIGQLWDARNHYCAAQVVKHDDYKTKAQTKYLGNKNEDYPRKNWSSVILWNAGHYAHRRLTPETIARMTGAELHRFTWIPEDRLGSLNPKWNHLISEHESDDDAYLYHYTLGLPAFWHYTACDHADVWHRAYLRAASVGGESPRNIAQRAEEHTHVQHHG